MSPGRPDLGGKLAVVTGASAGVGRAYALALACAGAQVVALARRADALAALARSSAGRIAGAACDVTDARQVDAALSGIGRIDILVNNVGAYPRYPTLEISDAVWEAQMAINLKSAFNAIRAALPAMIAAGAGSVINVTAGAAAPRFAKGEAGHDGLLLYAVAKAGLNRMTTFLAEDLREHAIAVNALSPGVVRSDIASSADLPADAGPGVKAADPEVLGPPLLHLAAQTAAGLTGQILHSDEFGRSWPAASPERSLPWQT